jgi:hypothetical protein
MYYKQLITIGLLSFFIGCGSSSSSTNQTQPSIENSYRVIDNLGVPIQKNFQGYH